MKHRVAVMGSVAALLVLAQAGEAKPRTDGGHQDPGRPYQSCLHSAASRYQVHPQLLTAIVRVENAAWNPWSVSINHRGKGYPQPVKSYKDAETLVTRLWKQNVNFDVGLGQVNTINMERYKIHPVALLDPCTNLRYAAMILRESIDRHGYNWKAIERYNGVNPHYPWKVLKELRRP